MTEAYLFHADLWCHGCIRKTLLERPEIKRMIPEARELDAAGLLRAILIFNGRDPDNESTWDSDEFPKGPYEEGGGEADTPQHCAGCRCFLENPLTEDGLAYVIEELNDDSGDPQIEGVWRDFYASNHYKGHPLHMYLIPGHYSAAHDGP